MARGFRTGAGGNGGGSGGSGGRLTATTRWHSSNLNKPLAPDPPPSDFTPGPLPLTLQTCNLLVRSPVICALSRWESRMKERLQGTEGKQQQHQQQQPLEKNTNR